MSDADERQASAPRRDGIARAFVFGTAWVGVGYALQAALRLAFIAVLTKHLDRAHFGYWALVAATAEILSPLAALGLTFGHTRHHAGADDRHAVYRHFLGSAVVVLLSGATFAALLAMLSAAFAQVFMHSSPLGQRVVGVGAALIFFTAVEWCLRFYYSTELQMGRRAMLGVSRFALELLAAVAGMVWGWNVVEIVGLVVVARAVPQFVAVAAIVRRKGLARPDFSGVSAAMRYGLPLQLASTAGTVTRFSDRLVLGALRPTAEVGAYSAVYEICAAHLVVVVAIEAAILPVLSALANRGHRRRARWMYLAALKYLLVATVPIAVLFSVAARPILSLVTRAEYVAILTDHHHWIAWGAVCYGVAILARVLLAVARRTVLAMTLMWATVAVKVALLFVGIHWWGARGAAIATFVAFAGLMVATLLLARRHLRVPPTRGDDEPEGDTPPDIVPFSVGGLARIAAAAAVAGLVLHRTVRPTVAGVLAALVAYGIAYGVALFALRAIRLDELAAVRRLMGAPRTDDSAA
ncbi:oligosaccharide flippase family protein [bacterium]|nr:oligosaccharide flippase family protein [bacterium]